MNSEDLNFSKNHKLAGHEATLNKAKTMAMHDDDPHHQSIHQDHAMSEYQKGGHHDRNMSIGDIRNQSASIMSSPRHDSHIHGQGSLLLLAS